MAEEKTGVEYVLVYEDNRKRVPRQSAFTDREKAWEKAAKITKDKQRSVIAVVKE